MISSPVESIGWVLPIDDTSFRIYTAGRARAAGDLARVRSRLNGKLWEELTEAEHQRFPGDYEAQVGQGADCDAFGRAPGVERPRRVAGAPGPSPVAGGAGPGARSRWRELRGGRSPTVLEAGNYLLS